MGQEQANSAEDFMRSHQRYSERLFTLLWLLSFISLLFVIYLFNVHEHARYDSWVWISRIYSLNFLAIATILPLLWLILPFWMPFKEVSSWSNPAWLLDIYMKRGRQFRLLRVIQSVFLGVGLALLVASAHMALPYDPPPPTEPMSNSMLVDLLQEHTRSFKEISQNTGAIHSDLVRLGTTASIYNDGLSRSEEVLNSSLVDLFQEHTHLMEDIAENIEAIHTDLAAGLQLRSIEATTAKGRLHPMLRWVLLAPAILIAGAIVWVVVNSFFYKRLSVKKSTAKILATVAGALVSISSAAFVDSMTIFDITIEVPKQLNIQTEKPPIKIENLLSLQGSPEFHLSYQGASLEGERIDFVAFSSIGPFESGESVLAGGVPTEDLEDVAEFVYSHEETVLFLVGGADRQHLSTDTQATYQTNIGLAHARAEFVRLKLRDHLDTDGGMPPTIIALPAGPSDLEIASEQDRKVTIYALGAGVIEKNETAQDESDQKTSDP